MSVDRIHRWVRVAEVVRKRNVESSRGAKLAMAVLCVACLVTGSAVREIMHWALGHRSPWPYTGWTTEIASTFRCSQGKESERTWAREPEPRPRAVTDGPRPMPVPVP